MFLNKVLSPENWENEYEEIRLLTPLEVIDRNRPRIGVDGYVLERVGVSVLHYLGTKITVRRRELVVLLHGCWTRGRALVPGVSRDSKAS